MSSRDRLIALAKTGGIGSLMVISLIAGIEWEECPTGSGAVSEWKSPTSFQMKSTVGVGAEDYVYAFNADGMLSAPSGPVRYFPTETRLHFWTDAESLLAWWPPYEARGVLACDVVQQGEGGVPLCGTLSGTTWAVGSKQFAFQFDGVDDRVDLGTLDPSGPPLRLEATIQVGAGLVPAVSGGARIIDKSTSALNYWQLTLYQTRAQPDSFQIRFRVRTTAGMVTAITPTYCVKVGRWHRVVGVYNGKTAKVYVDGILRTSAPWTGTIVAAPIVPVYIGWGGHGGQPFKGKIDDIKIGRRATS